jgi:hypothetical protein
MFRFFFSQPISNQISGTLIKGSLLTGLFLIGFGMLVFILRDLFAFLAAALFFMAGFSAIGYAIRMWILKHKIDRMNRGGRDNVTIHYQ